MIRLWYSRFICIRPLGLLTWALTADVIKVCVSVLHPFDIASFPPLDLAPGRTFPTHPYFSAQLGAGQLSLFNLLKAYSLLDSEVGYCQGISFVAGVLLLHMSEEQAFEMLKFLMYDLGFRKQYRPDMMSLQVRFKMRFQLGTRDSLRIASVLSKLAWNVTYLQSCNYIKSLFNCEIHPFSN